jgi:hypothetical protein
MCLPLYPEVYLRKSPKIANGSVTGIIQEFDGLDEDSSIFFQLGRGRNEGRNWRECRKSGESECMYDHLGE